MSSLVDPPARLSGCPSDLELEVLLAARSPSSTFATHRETCVSCRERLGWMTAVGLEFQDVVRPRTRARVLAALEPRRRPWLPLAALVSAVAVVLLVVLMPWRGSPSSTYVGLKGAPVGAGAGAAARLEVYVGDHGRGRRLSNGETVHANDGLRFIVRAPGQQAFVFSIDASGAVSRIFPEGDEGLVPGDGVLPIGALVDGTPGPERIFAVFPSRPMRFEQVEAAVREAVRDGGAVGVRRLEQLPLDVEHDSVLLEKAAP